MVKTPRTRHSKSAKEPVTIDLQPGEVSRVKAEAEQAEPGVGGTPNETEAEDQASVDQTAGVEASTAETKAKSSVSAASAARTSGESAKATGDASSAAPPSPGTKKSASEDAATRERSRPSAGASTTSSGSNFGRQEPSASEAGQRNGRGGALAAGLAGGIVALALAGGLQFAGLLPGTERAGGEQGQAVAALDAQIAALREQVATLGAAGGEDPGLENRLAQAEERAATLASDVEALRDEVSRMDPQTDGEASSVDLSPLEERIAAIETTLAGINNTGTPQADLAAVDEQIETLRQEIATASDDQAGTLERLVAVEQAVATLTSRVEENAEVPATAVIIAASALKAAIDRGTPFMTELETFASLAPDAPETAELRDLAASGVPARTQIAAESDAAANAMIAATQPVDPQAGVFDRLWGSAMGLVQVRPVGMVEGDDVPEIVARLDAAIAAQDYERAIVEFETLPDAAKMAGEAFMAKVRARHAADRLIDQALATALKA